MKPLKVGDYLHFITVDKDISIGWNRFKPIIFVFNREARKLLDRLRAGHMPGEEEELAPVLEAFEKSGFLYRGDSDPYRREFIHEIGRALDGLCDSAGQFYREKADYYQLKIVTDRCNLACSYCVNQYDQDNRKKICQTSVTEKSRFLKGCIDQYFSRKKNNNPARAQLFFNGGEILMEWPLIKELVDLVSRDYKEIDVTYELNTNLTLLTEEMAHFFAQKDFRIHISIDGYQSVHDRTRKFFDGSGSFDEIMERVKLYRKHTSGRSLESFQGTLDGVDEFDPREVYKMGRYGFNRARLAPNLLNTTPEDAVNKAAIMGEFLELNRQERFQVSELIFTRSKERVNREDYDFEFNCLGLSPFPLANLEVNLSTLSISHLCGFIGKAAMPLSELDQDIYNPRLWERSFGFIRERMEMLFEQCMDCEVVAVCAGGCVMSGLDNRNKINPAACIYQKEMWRIYLRQAYRNSQK